MNRELAKVRTLMFVFALILSFHAQAVVFINEVFLNPPLEDTYYEFIELMGTPGMKLDGYAIATLNGAEDTVYPLGSITSAPATAPEIDEFFSLDGLSLGSNGLLVLLMNTPSLSYYPDLYSSERMSDSNWFIRDGCWNGGLDDPGSIKDNGSTTIFLVRNRPGITEADPCNLDGLRWGKEILHDAILKTPYWDDRTSTWTDRWGNGDLDEGEPNGLGGNTLDMTGTSTPADANDDLEIVDEVSFEDGQGWEYDTDNRHVDANSPFDGLPHRHVHALDDPANFNPDALSRVDYRTKGQGWAPEGDYGEMSNGNNWQDTATEQWIRGRSLYYPIAGQPKRFYYDNEINSDPDAVVPYNTHVPMWLYDSNVPDYNFADVRNYEIVAGKINPLAVAFIPGDCDRDGVCDINDITKLASVFGEYDWIFANSSPDACETDFGDPAIQTRPWDIDATGDNGIECSDLQWTLNFQGDSTGQIVGIKYDSYTPAAAGVYLNSNVGVQCTVTTAVNIPSGRALDSLYVGDIVEITVEGEVTAGPNTVSGHENGIMQYVHDITISSPNVVKVTNIEALGSFSKTQASLEILQGTAGDLGVELVNGFTTSFTQGLSEPNELYLITLEAIGEGSANVTVSSAVDSMFAVSTPDGLKIGHTNNNGDPNFSYYPSLLSITSTAATLSADFDDSNGVDFKDFAVLAEQWKQTGVLSADISPAGGDGVVDYGDLEEFMAQWLAGIVEPIADINNDNKVNFKDFAVLAEQWKQTGVLSADIAPEGGDGVVDYEDLEAFTGQWLAGF